MCTLFEEIAKENKDEGKAERTGIFQKVWESYFIKR